MLQIYDHIDDVISVTGLWWNDLTILFVTLLSFFYCLCVCSLTDTAKSETQGSVRSRWNNKHPPKICRLFRKLHTFIQLQLKTSLAFVTIARIMWQAGKPCFCFIQNFVFQPFWTQLSERSQRMCCSSLTGVDDHWSRSWVDGNDMVCDMTWLTRPTWLERLFHSVDFFSF